MSENVLEMELEALTRQILMMEKCNKPKEMIDEFRRDRDILLKKMNAKKN
jgi:hypothetical protein